MSEIKAIEKLRDYANEHIINGPLMNAMIDEIEREIAECYMKAPVDADGVPIHIRDEVVPGGGEPFIVGALNNVDGQYRVLSLVEDSTHWHWPHGLRHVKPRTVEDVLMDAGVSVAAISDVAAEIRELLGGDGR